MRVQRAAMNEDFPYMQRVALTVERRLNAAEGASLEAFARLFFRWAARINLGSIAGRADLVDRHLIDAFAAARFIGE